jgi:hypothetical protein
VNPVGIVEDPAAYVGTPRAYSARLRLAAIAILGAFVVGGVGTTVYSLGAYCLTTWAGVPFQNAP